MAQKKDQEVSFWKDSDFTAAQKQGMDIRDNPRSLIPNFAAIRAEPTDRDTLISALMGLRGSQAGAQPGVALGDPLTAALGAIGGAATQPGPQALAMQRAQAQQQAQLAALQAMPVDALSPDLVAAHPELRGVPLAVVHQIAPIIEKAQAFNESHYNIDQAANLIAPDGKPESVAKAKAQLRGLFPNGIVPKDFAHVAVASNRAELTMGEKQDQFLQKEYDKLVEKNNPFNGNSRSVIGMVGRANYNAQRALTTLSKPVVTNQEAGNVMADIAAIYQGGAPTQFGMSEQQYKTLYGKLQELKQEISGKPTDALPDAIKERLVGVLSDMRNDNATILRNNFNAVEKAQGKILKDPAVADQWKEFRSSIEGSFAGGSESPASGVVGSGEIRKRLSGGKIGVWDSNGKFLRYE